MATNATWTVIFGDKMVINTAVKNAENQPVAYSIDDDSFWNQSHFSNLWAIQYGTATPTDAVEYKDETPHSAHDAVTHGNFNEFITRWDTAHLAALQSAWDGDNDYTMHPDVETAEQKINRLGARPTSFNSPAV
jgi:hypothetical protein